MDFEWDEDKNERNINKHGISFYLADLAFNQTMITTEDTRQDYGEERYIAFSLERVVKLLTESEKHGNLE